MNTADFVDPRPAGFGLLHLWSRMLANQEITQKKLQSEYDRDGNVKMDVWQIRKDGCKIRNERIRKHLRVASIGYKLRQNV